MPPSTFRMQARLPFRVPTLVIVFFLAAFTTGCVTSSESRYNISAFEASKLCDLLECKAYNSLEYADGSKSVVFDTNQDGTYERILNKLPGWQTTTHELLLEIIVTKRGVIRTINLAFDSGRWQKLTAIEYLLIRKLLEFTDPDRGTKDAMEFIQNNISRESDEYLHEEQSFQWGTSRIYARLFGEMHALTIDLETNEELSHIYN